MLRSGLLRHVVRDVVIIALVGGEDVLLQGQPGRLVKRAEREADRVLVMGCPEQGRTAARAKAALGGGGGLEPLHRAVDLHLVLWRIGRGPQMPRLLAALAAMADRGAIRGSVNREGDIAAKASSGDHALPPSKRGRVSG